MDGKTFRMVVYVAPRFKCLVQISLFLWSWIVNNYVHYIHETSLKEVPYITHVH